MAREAREHSLNELMYRLGNAKYNSEGRTPLEAEYERRKFLWQKAAVIIAAIGVFVAVVGVTVAAIRLGIDLSGVGKPQ
jgi:hypothetical protein